MLVAVQIAVKSAGVSWCSYGEISSRTVGGPSVQVTAGCGHRSVAKRGLHKMDWASSLESVAGVSVPQPVRTHWCLNPGSARSGSNYAKNLRMAKGSALARSKDWGNGIAIAT